MRIATYNVNGVNGRLANLLEWLEEARPDIVCLQELKAPDETFPAVVRRRASFNAVLARYRVYGSRKDAGVPSFLIE
jgi:exodeoxyribonuclease-3